MVLWLFIEYKSIVKMANPIIVVMFRKHFKIEHTHESTEQTGYEDNRQPKTKMDSKIVHRMEMENGAIKLFLGTTRNINAYIVRVSP